MRFTPAANPGDKDVLKSETRSGTELVFDKIDMMQAVIHRQKQLWHKLLGRPPILEPTIYPSGMMIPADQFDEEKDQYRLAEQTQQAPGPVREYRV
jgi:hypothetical protein